MRIVIDTNVLLSAVFFGGTPQRVVDAVMRDAVSAYATQAIIEEYREAVSEMIARKQGRLRRNLLQPFLGRLCIVDAFTQVHICRDPDDDKFIACAVDAAASCIVSGDKDLLSIGEHSGVKIVTAAEYCKCTKI